MQQKVIYEERETEILKEINNIFRDEKVKKLFIVCGNNCKRFLLVEGIKKIHPNICFFSEFESNPKYESIVNGIEKYRDNSCDSILAIGGGSAIDVAKCIKLYFWYIKEDIPFFKRNLKENIHFPILITIPTTAGTGSESTQFAVIYYEKIKISIDKKEGLPDYVILNPNFLKSLPLYHKKCCMLDALSHAIESTWSLKSNEESRTKSSKAIRMIIENYKDYLKNNKKSSKEILIGANIAGQAINITRTTAAHAMSYILTSTYNISHGHAVAICIPYIWEFMINNMDKCVDKRGQDYLIFIFNMISENLGGKSIKEGIEIWKNILIELELECPEEKSNDEIERVATAVNVERLKNSPVLLQKVDILNLYKNILSKNHK